MPSLKMKAKSTVGCLREKKGLGICPKSSVISKNNHFISKISQDTEELGSMIQNIQDVCSCDKGFSNDGGGANEVLHTDYQDGENPLIHDQHLSILDSETVNRTESAPATCTSSETIFSPILESIDIKNESFVGFFGGINNLYVPQLETEDSDDSSKGSCEYQNCSISDFFVSDMGFSGLPVDGNLFYDYSTGNTFFPDYKCDEPITPIDLPEENLVKQDLTSAMENGDVCDAVAAGDSTTNSLESDLYLAIHQLRSCDQESDLNIYSDMDQPESFDPQMFIRNVPDLPDLAPDSLPTIMQKSTKSVTLVLDLDETLVHSTLDPCDNADFTFPVFFNMKEHTVYVKQRPHLRTFLERVAEVFEVVIFTASQSIYAKQLLDILDPEGKFFSRRAYRESCIFSDGSYMKDLTVLGVDLAKVFIIDNSPQVFRMQVNNGIPIRSWFDDPSDSALIALLPFLETLVDVDDVRPIIAMRFGNKE